MARKGKSIDKIIAALRKAEVRIGLDECHIRETDRNVLRRRRGDRLPGADIAERILVAEGGT